MCIRVELNQTKNGLSPLLALVMKVLAAASNSSSIVSIRFLVSGPVFSMRWPPFGSAQVWSTPRGAYLARKAGSFG